MKNALNGVSPDISVERISIYISNPQRISKRLRLEADKLNWKVLKFL